MIFGMSSFSTFSLGRKRESIQNIDTAPIALKVKSTIGETIPELEISFVVTILMPKMEYAARLAR